MTGRPCSTAILACARAPLCSPASTTTVARPYPDIVALRIRKVPLGRGVRPELRQQRAPGRDLLVQGAVLGG
jgi:hypothetical protein